ncbi:galectin-1-like [Eublepharis macularius]|uniref:Galectin n=1 Tax=Eublepharis macularius TaxID=481883 RepID=A0AA97J159_EUBMA|nr:galectin-1-like [Eublepharis macularius]
MANQLSITNLKTVRGGDSILVQGKVPPNAERFAIDLGRDSKNYLIHFNPRFAEKVIVYNSMTDGNWSTETRDFHFPFKQGEVTKVLFTLERDEVKVTYPDGYVFDYKSKSNLDYVDYVQMAGIETQSIDIK